MDNPLDKIIIDLVRGEVAQENIKEIKEWSTLSDSDKDSLIEVCKLFKKIQSLNEMQQIDSKVALKRVYALIEENNKREAEKRESETRETRLNITDKRGIKFYISLWKNISAILILPIAVYLITSQIIKLDDKIDTPLYTIESSSGQRSYTTLPDGTEVWLNSGSSLSYPLRFDSDKRVVMVEKGEIFFKVAKDSLKPFRVKVNSLTVEATGTQFDIINYKDENEIEIALIEGGVKIDGDKMRDTEHLTPNQLLTYSKGKGNYTLESVNMELFSRWREGKFMVRDLSFKDLLAKISRWYNVEFTVAEGLNYRDNFTGTFDGEDIYKILEYIELTAPLKFTKVKGDKAVDGLIQKTIIKVTLE